MNSASLITKGIILIAICIGMYNWMYWKKVREAKETLGIHMPLVVCILSVIGIWLVIFSGIVAISILV